MSNVHDLQRPAPKMPEQIEKGVGPFNAPEHVYFGIAATGIVNGDEFILVAPDVEALSRTWSIMFAGSMELDTRKLHRAGVVPRKEIERKE